jgi:hypothetical protein
MMLSRLSMPMWEPPFGILGYDYRNVVGKLYMGLAMAWRSEAKRCCHRIAWCTFAYFVLRGSLDNMENNGHD